MADLTEQECEALITWCSNKSAYYGRRSESMASISEFVATGFDSSKTALAIVHCEVEERTQRAEHTDEGDLIRVYPPTLLRKFADFCDASANECDGLYRSAQSVGPLLGPIVARGDQTLAEAYKLTRDLLRREAGPVVP